VSTKSIKDRRLHHVVMVATTSVAIALAGVGASVAPVAADCGSDGIAWPAKAKAVQGLTFLGTMERTVSDVPGRGETSIIFTVDKVFDGEAGKKVTLTPWCVGTPFKVGHRYLISTSDRLPLPGTKPTLGDRQSWFTDGFAVAWRVSPDRSVRLLGYPGGRGYAPRFLKRPSTVRQAVKAVVPKATPSAPAIVEPAVTLLGLGELTASRLRAAIATVMAR
jgi:hypothetical protein